MTSILVIIDWLGIVYKTYQQDKKYKEHVSQKEQRSQKWISSFYRMEIEISQNSPE